MLNTVSIDITPDNISTVTLVKHSIEFENSKLEFVFIYCYFI